MNHELTTVAWLHGKQVPVTVAYDLDGYKPIGMWVMDEAFNDITVEIDEAEYGLLYARACEHVAESMTEAAEMMAEGER